jgi:putative sigma-54 modulation protein
MSSYPIEIAARHMEITDSMRDYVREKLANIHLQQPRITDAKVVLDVATHGQIAEIILYCANHTTLEAKTETDNLYEAIDLTIAKILRQMRKEKTRLEKLNHGRA